MILSFFESLLFLKGIFSIYSIFLRTYTLTYFTSPYKLFQVTGSAEAAFHKNADLYKNVKQLPTLSDLGSTAVDNPRLAAIALPLMKKIATTPSKAKISFLLIIPFFLVIYYAGFSPRMT